MINPTGSRIVLKYPDALALPKGAPEGAKAKYSQITEVIEVGPEITNKKQCKKGAVVLYEDYGFFDIEVAGVKYLIGEEKNISGYPDEKE